eukprot:TRINITY_DN1766_c0_g1_i4.p1 TRINITY_DN1766_c0_g1~~TRINITY_DN1766_c0_g1_i4.p1  ORF type:complete len:634 (-),score=95.75 TRINITY_DN1766_c0_g1_i4:175-2076(-)
MKADNVFKKLNKLIKTGNEKRLLKFIEKIGIQTIDRDGRNVLHHIVLQDSPSVLALVLNNFEAGKIINRFDKYGDTCFLLACSSGSNSLIAILMECDEINYRLSRKSDNSSALHCIACRCDLKNLGSIINFLIRNGVSRSLKDNEGNTALHLVTSLSLYTNIQILLHCGSDPNVSNYMFETPLHIACQLMDNKIIKLLLSWGSSPYLADIYGNTPAVYLEREQLFPEKKISPIKIPPVPINTSREYDLNMKRIAYIQLTYKIPKEDVFLYISEYISTVSNDIIQELCPLGFGVEWLQFVVYSITTCKIFQWDPSSIYNNKIVIFKWLPNFLDTNQKRSFFEYLSSEYPHDFDIIAERNTVASLPNQHKPVYKNNLVCKKHKSGSLSRSPQEIFPNCNYSCGGPNKLSQFDWEISTNDLCLEEKIGQGSYAKVYKCSYENKIYSLKKFPENGDVNKILKEISILSILESEYIIEFVGASLDMMGSIGIVTPYYSRGSLKNYMKDNHLGFELKLKFCKQLAMALKYIHNLDPAILHKDINCSNLLLSGGNNIVIADFGQSSEETNTGEENNIFGSLNWMDPDVIIHGVPYSKYSDIYSYGMTVYEIVHDGLHPYHEYDDVLRILNAFEEGVLPIM